MEKLAIPRKLVCSIVFINYEHSVVKYTNIQSKFYEFPLKQTYRVETDVEP